MMTPLGLTSTLHALLNLVPRVLVPGAEGEGLTEGHDLGLSALGRTSPLYINNQSESLTTRCYGIYGCFTVDQPFLSLARPVNVFPLPPSAIAPAICLYTRSSPTECQLVHVDDARSVGGTSFRPGSKVKILTHGYLEHGRKNWLKSMVREYLVHGDYNVLVVDWLAGSGPPYTQAVANIRLIGVMLAHFIIGLQARMGVKPENVHLVGHSLGAQMAGYTGQYLREHGVTLGRITGSAVHVCSLDPAEPHFEGTDLVVRLDPGDAALVDVIHTDAGPIITGGLGILQPSGHLDFYPNGGVTMPGCGAHLVESVAKEQGNIPYGIRRFIGCNHIRSYEYFTESINSQCPFLGIQCESWDAYWKGKCWQCGAGQGRNGRTCARMGAHADIPYIIESSQDDTNVVSGLDDAQYSGYEYLDGDAQYISSDYVDVPFASNTIDAPNNQGHDSVPYASYTDQISVSNAVNTKRLNTPRSMKNHNDIPYRINNHSGVPHTRNTSNAHVTHTINSILNIPYMSNSYNNSPYMNNDHNNNHYISNNVSSVPYLGNTDDHLLHRQLPGLSSLTDIPDGDGVSKKLFLITGSDPPFCLYHHRVSLVMSYTAEARDHGGDIGVFYITLAGSRATSPRIQLNPEEMFFEPGNVYTYMVGTGDLGHLQHATLQWSYVTAYYNPLTWRLLSSPSVFVNRVHIQSVEMQESYEFCGLDQPFQSGWVRQLVWQEVCPEQAPPPGESILGTIINFDVGDTINSNIDAVNSGLNSLGNGQLITNLANSANQAALDIMEDAKRRMGRAWSYRRGHKVKNKKKHSKGRWWWLWGTWRNNWNYERD